MRQVICSMGMSLDGYINDRDGALGWSAPSPELFRTSIEEIRTVGVHLLGRRLYETMRYWDEPENQANFDEAEQEWAALWNPLPKVVFSATLESVDPSARLATASVAEEIERLRAEAADGDIAIGGATLVAAAAQAGLIDEYRVRVLPSLLGGGTPLFAAPGRHVDLELVEHHTFASGVVSLRYRVTR